MTSNNSQIDTQRQYYAQTAQQYDDMHVHENDEHYFALALLVASLDYLQIKSILDIGSGTGRALNYIRQRRPDIHIVGIEPVKELRQIGHKQGISEDMLIDGDATNLSFADGQFDLVSEFGVLHHIRKPQQAVAQMLRVAGKAIFISDSNNFGQGSAPARLIKQLLNTFKLWPIADRIKTGGKGYILSEGDGLAYSYSVFNNYRQIQDQCQSIHLLNTVGGQLNMYRTASHVALLGIKK
jgi:ubiquinone/menaquinone biosynthesis C-methylase UbiE